ncbi:MULTISPECIES: hypothetical protein [Aphanothece]|uniref:hypothetical protein n=1 Tax=Aphanothece TaxID=1121 RepID=UPI003984AD0A
MPTPEPPPLPNTDLAQLVAAAADLCRKPLRHAVLPGQPGEVPRIEDCCLKIEVRGPDGERLPREDLELELYRSGGQLNLTLAWATEPERPMLWHGLHPVWMAGETGQRCARPLDGAPLEALARRLRALLA